MGDFKRDYWTAQGLPAVLQVSHLRTQEVHEEVCVQHHIESLKVHELVRGFNEGRVEATMRMTMETSDKTLQMCKSCRMTFKEEPEQKEDEMKIAFSAWYCLNKLNYWTWDAGEDLINTCKHVITNAHLIISC